MEAFHRVHAYPGPSSTIHVIQGGNNLHLLGFDDLCRADMLLALDSENEINRVLRDRAPANLRVFPLAQRQTARTLAEGASDDIRQCVATTAGMAADCGLGQVRGIGYLATRRLLASREMQDFLNHELLDTLMQRSGGVLDHVRIIGEGSVAGGTASAGLLLVVAALEAVILEKTNATVHTDLRVAGSLSYMALGPRVHTNAAAGIVEILAYVTSKQQHNRAIRSVRFSELPPVGEDRAERTRFMLEVEQAVQCPEVQATLDSLDANASQNGPFGVSVHGGCAGRPQDATGRVETRGRQESDGNNEGGGVPQR